MKLISKNQEIKSVGIFKKFLCLHVGVFIGLSAFSQKDDYMDKLDEYRMSFFNTFFNPEIELNSKSLSGKKREISLSYVTKDSLTRPVNYENYGLSYFERIRLSFFITASTAKYPANSCDTLGRYYFFEYFHTNAFDKDIYVNRSDIWDSLDNLVQIVQDSVKKLESHQLHLLKDTENNKYYITSSKSSGILKVNIKRRDIKILQKNDHSVEKGKLRAIISFLSMLHFTHDLEGGMKELSLNQCYPLTD